MRIEYRRNGLMCVLDRSRGYLVHSTPEEDVRQETLDWLIDDHRVPAALVRSEFHTARRGGSGRADVLVLAPGSTDYAGKTVLVVECKKRGTFLDDKAREQATGYANTVGARYAVLTNGDEQVPLAKDRGRWRKLTKVPSWREMLKQRGLRWAPEVQHRRSDWSDIETAAKCDALVEPGSPYESVFGEDSPRYLMPFVFNLYGCLAFDHELALPLEDDSIAVVKDLGPRARWFGNVSGGTWPSDWYRSLLVLEKASGSHQVVSLTILAGAKYVNDPRFGNNRASTCLIVSVDDGPTSHNSLQMPLDHFVTEAAVRAGQVVLRHNGRMSAGKGGSIANHVVLSFVRRAAPHLVEANAILLGTLPADRLVTWTDAGDFLLRVVRYALARDALRRELRAGAAKLTRGRTRRAAGRGR